MVGLGTILSVGIAGAVAIGSYALYVNRDKLGGALSRGVETNVINPLGNYFDSLWSAIANPTKGTNLSPSTPRPTTQTILTKEGLTQVPLRTPTGKTQQQVLQQAPQLIPVKTTLARTPDYRPSTAYKAGYYYFDYGVNKYDRQQYLSAASAKQLLTADPAIVFQQGGLENIKYLGASKLGSAGFQLFGKSQNYL